MSHGLGDFLPDAKLKLDRDVLIPLLQLQAVRCSLLVGLGQKYKPYLSQAHVEEEFVAKLMSICSLSDDQMTRDFEKFDFEGNLPDRICIMAPVKRNLE